MLNIGKIKDGLKNLTGLGLNANEKYLRAYSHGVFKQEYEYATKTFLEASEMLAKEGNQEMSNRAKANALLYALARTKDFGLVPDTIATLQTITEIERLGTQNEMVPTTPLATELAALQTEKVAENANKLEEREATYKQAADMMMKLGNAELQFVERFQLKGPADKAMKRGYYYMALGDYSAGVRVLDEFPMQSQDFLQRSANLFKQAQTPDWEEKVTDYVERIRIKRHCWMCGREVQGRGVFWNHYPADVKKYHHHLVEELKQDPHMLENDKLTLCTACGSTIEYQADAYAVKRMNELRAWAEPIFQDHADQLATHASAINELQRAVSRLQDQAHTHNS